MAEPTRGDVDLVLKLYDLRREGRMREARSFMMQEYHAEDGKDFMTKYPPGSSMNASFRQCTSYWDMVGVFVRRGLLHKELLFDTAAEFHILWEKVKPAVYDLRKMRNNPHYLKNLEELATQHKAFMEGRAPGSSAYFASLAKPERPRA